MRNGIIHPAMRPERGKDAVALTADPGTAGDQAYDRIRTDIIFGRLRPGQKLTLEKLRSQYGVAISTLREIFSRLAPEGLVVAEGQRGFHVASCSAKDFKEIASLRLLLEHYALEESFRAGDVEWEARIVAAHHKLAHLEASILSGDSSKTELWKHYDCEFHQALVSACGSRVLMAEHASVYDRYLRYQMVFVIFRGQEAAEEHKQLLDCALRYDVKAAQDILTRHVEACVDYALRNNLIT
jgi:DNA-binding GntR family transcriptional regulator